MALNKRKVLDAARKFAQKGAKAKALKEYDKLLQADPRDAKLLLEVGDAYRRWGQAEDAIAQYSKVAAQYRQDGFDARAVAVFKQILNLDPKQHSAYVSLSELYQRMGLDSEAAAALQTAADGYHKEGRKTEALDLLRQMGALDPSNTTNRTKVAELLRQEGMTDAALAEYEAISTELGNQQDRDQLIVVQERILELSPNHVQALSGLARTLMSVGDLGRAEPYAARAAAAAPEPPQYELLIDLYAQMGNDEGLATATRALAKIYRDRGDEDKARELMQRLDVADSVSSGSRLAVDLSDVEEPDLGDEELLDDEPFLTLDDEEDAFSSSSARPSLAFEEFELDTPAPEPPITPATPTSTPSPTPGPEGDPDQLLAEASVYLRYGKCEQAVRSLEAILAIDPGHLGALEKLGECRAESDEHSAAVQIWLRAAERAREENDNASVERLRGRVSELDPALAATIQASAGTTADAFEDSMPSISGVEADITDATDPGDEFDLDLDLDDAIDAVSESETDTGYQAEAGAQGTSPSFEIDLDDESIVFDEPPNTNADVADSTKFDLELETDDSSPMLEDDAIDFEIDVDLDGDQEVELDAFEDDVSETISPAPDDSPAMDESQIGEELEEAEFYIAQDMFDEAEAIVARILEAVPGHAAALVMSGEITAGRGVASDELSEAMDVASDSPVETQGATALELEMPETTDSLEDELDESGDLADGLDVDLDAEIDLDAAIAAAAANAPEEAPVEEVVEVADAGQEEVAFELEIGPDGLEDLDADPMVAEDAEDEMDPVAEVTFEMDAEESPAEDSEPAETLESAPSLESFEDIAATEAEAAAPEAAAAEEEEEAAQAEVSVTEDPAADEMDAAEAPAPAEDSFDLREALADVLDEEPEAETGPTEEGGFSTVEDGFESIFSDFKKGVTATLDDGDYDTRYDLGIAYREMGLFDDAIAEFRICLDSPDRQFDSLYLMGLCARDLQRWDDAINHLEQALALPEIPEERLAGVYFDLSVAHEGAEDFERAASTLNRVLELEPEFPGATERLELLQSGKSSLPELGNPGEVYESFDDLFDADEADEDGDEAVAQAVPEEAFESFADVVDVSDEIDESDESNPSEESDEPDDEGGKKTGRRRISFV